MILADMVVNPLQATAGPTHVRKPPAAPAPRPQSDPAPFGKSGVSISKNLGRAPAGALSDEVCHPDAEISKTIACAF